MANLMEYKCPCCAGKLNFDSGVQKMKCPYCDNEFEMATLQEMDEELNSGVKDEMKWTVPSAGDWGPDADNLRAYICKSCGGEIVGDANLAATSCPYCDNPVVMTGQVSGELKPELIIPFKLDKAAAMEGLKKHFQGKKLLPKVFAKQNHIEEVKGVYVPFWLFDTTADGAYNYKTTKVKRWSDDDYNYEETSYYSVYRKGKIGFAGIPVDGSSKMEDDMMESLEPYDLNDAVPFQTAYMAGYLADKYDVSSEESVQRANQRVKQSTSDAFRRTVVGYDSVVTEKETIQLEDGRARYALYPVWLLNTEWNGQKYTFAMNGQTGKFVGNLPVDKGAYWKWCGIYAAIVGAVTFGALFLFSLL